MTLNIKSLTQIDKLTYSEPLTRTINLGLNPIQDGSFRGCSQKGGEGGRGTKGPPFLKSVTNILYLSINHVTHHLRSSDISIFLTEISKFCYIEKYRYKFVRWYIISNSFNFLWVAKHFFNKHGYNFDDVNKNGYSRRS